ncbi:MAG TPA: pyridoxamine 5'-phosphate oxidase family protein [Mucilaginibacter sp.]|nr:pyridoxamine 5'-phosphate oxidase family protein [Mucilaginibacter sp.]
MLRELNDTQIDELLKSQLIGRIGCHSATQVYVVPVNYIYEAPDIYCHSAKGLKIDLMRNNPQIFFEVDYIKDITNWQSVIVQGRFEELTNMEEKQNMMQKLIDRVTPFVLDDSVPPSHGFVDAESDVGDTVELIVYKISVISKTGRFEKR